MSGKIISDLDIGVNQGTVDAIGGSQRRLSLKIATIKNVYPDTNTVDLEWLWPIRGGVNNLQISRPYVGYRSGIHFVPEIGSTVIIGYAFNKIVMLSYLMPSGYDKLIEGYKDSSGVPSRIRQMSIGEVSMNSIQDSEIYLHEQVTIRDRNNDRIEIDPTDSSISMDSIILYIDNEAGNITMGPVKRGGEIITTDGQPVLSPTGGEALTELSVSIQKFSNGTIFDGTQTNRLLHLTAGTLVDADGLQVVDQANKKVIFNTDFDTSTTPTLANANLKVDESGNFNINDGNMLKPTDIPAIPIPLLTTTTGTTFTAQSQQRAARQGDRIVIPMTPPVKSAIDHPNLVNKATYNLAQMQQVASMIMTPFGPCIGFIPVVPDTRLVGEITQGSDSVFIGSLDKNTENKETLDNSL